MSDKPRTTQAERRELSTVIRMRAKAQKAMADQRAAEVLADFEQQLAKEYNFGDDAWREITAAAKVAVKAADARIAQICRERGIPDAFRPGLSLNWYKRGESAAKDRRVELRKVATTRVEAMRKAAHTQIDTQHAELATQLVAGGLETSLAQKFLEALPSVESLMPEMRLKEIEGE